MLGHKAPAPFDSCEHLFEIKWDGIRCLAGIQTNSVRLQSRQSLDITRQFPELACLNVLPPSTVLDGELIVLHQGKPSLREVERRALLQNRARIQFLSQSMTAIYMVFDVLHLEGKSLMSAPLCQRRQTLKALLARVPLPGVLVSQAILRHGRELFALVAQLGLEGVVAKRLDGPYLPGKRSRLWLKIKPVDYPLKDRRRFIVPTHAN